MVHLVPLFLFELEMFNCWVEEGRLDQLAVMLLLVNQLLHFLAHRITPMSQMIYLSKLNDHFNRFQCPGLLPGLFFVSLRMAVLKFSHADLRQFAISVLKK
jgi:hypothetical protein